MKKKSSKKSTTETPAKTSGRRRKAASASSSTVVLGVVKGKKTIELTAPVSGSQLIDWLTAVRAKLAKTDGSLKQVAELAVSTCPVTAAQAEAGWRDNAKVAVELKTAGTAIVSARKDGEWGKVKAMSAIMEPSRFLDAAALDEILA